MSKTILYSKVCFDFIARMLYNTYRFGGRNMDKLSREEVLHVLNLARLNASDEE